MIYIKQNVFFKLKYFFSVISLKKLIQINKYYIQINKI